VAAQLYASEGPILVLAPPGTGKTYQLARRIKHLVEEQEVPPDQITVITFTGAAAREMRARISNPDDQALYVPPDRQPRNMCTMHSLGYSIIHARADKIDLSVPINVVVRDHTVNLLMGDAAQLLGLQRQVGDQVSRCRQYGDCCPTDDDRCRTCQQYQAILRACNAVDYNDQILLACQLLEKDVSLLEEYRAKARHLLIDEYQDINAAQFRLIKLLAGSNLAGLFAVGDDDQSIYSWRGGSPVFIRRFCDDYGPSASVQPLTRSRRCHQHILEGALAIVREHDPSRLDKAIEEYEYCDGPKITIHNVPSDKREAEIALAIIQQALPSKSVLILVPTRAYSQLLVEQLRRARVDYYASEPLPGQGLPLLCTLAAWLKNETDSIALRECMQAMIDSGVFKVPGPRARKPEKIAAREAALRSVAMCWELVLAEHVSLWESLCASADNDELLYQLREALSCLRSIDRQEVPVFLAEATRLLKPWANSDALLDEISTWVRASDIPNEPTPPAVRVMTLQGAKGLEADVVCVLGAEKGTIPKATSDPDVLAEQARLMYVSMTRAKSELHIFHARKRSAAVSFQSPYAKGEKTLEPSPFLDLIPNDHCKRRYHRSTSTRLSPSV